jgi:hypothetical protein
MGKGEEIPKTNPAEIEAVIARVKQSDIEQRDVALIERLLRTVLVLVKLLERKFRCIGARSFRRSLSSVQ